MKSKKPGYGFITDNYDQFQFIYVLKGELLFSKNGREAACSPGRIIVLTPGSAFSLSCEKRGYEGLFAIVYRPGLSLAAPTTSFRAGVRLRQLAEIMHGEIMTPTQGSREMMRATATAMAHLAARGARRSRREPMSEDQYAHYWAACARQALDARLYTGQSAREVMGSLKLSYRQLSRHFHQIYDETPKQYQVRARIEEAKRLLKETNLPITSVAFELGYATSQHFATQFQGHVGVTPKAFKKRSAN